MLADGTVCCARVVFRVEQMDKSVLIFPELSSILHSRSGIHIKLMVCLRG